MVKVKPRAVREANFRRAIPGVSASYRAGIEGTSGWQQAAIAGQDLYEAKMRDQNVLSRREKALARVSDSEWKQGAINKGVGRIASGMEQGAAKQAANFEPYAQALESVALPPRTADPIANIDNRVKPIVAALVNTKQQIG